MDAVSTDDDDSILPDPYGYRLQMSSPLQANTSLTLMYGKRELETMLATEPAWLQYLAAQPPMPQTYDNRLALLCEFMGEFVNTWAHGPAAALVEEVVSASGSALHNVMPVGISSTGIAVVVAAAQLGGPLALYVNDLERSGAQLGTSAADDRVVYRRCSIVLEGSTLVSLCGDFASVYYPANAALLCYTLKHRTSTATDALCGVFTLPAKLRSEGYTVLQAISDSHTVAFLVRAPTATTPECVFGNERLMVHLAKVGPRACNIDEPVHPYTGEHMTSLLGLGLPKADEPGDKRAFTQQPCYVTYDELTPGMLVVGTAQGCAYVVQLDTTGAASTYETLVTAGPAIVQLGASAEMDMHSKRAIDRWPGLEPVELMRCRGLELRKKSFVEGAAAAAAAADEPGVWIVSDGRIFARMTHSISFRAPAIVPESSGANNVFVLAANLCYPARQQRDLELAVVDIAFWGSLLVTYDGAGFVRLGSTSPAQTGEAIGAGNVECSWLSHTKLPVRAAAGGGPYRAIYCTPMACFVMMRAGGLLKLCKKVASAVY